MYTPPISLPYTSDSDTVRQLAEHFDIPTPQARIRAAQEEILDLFDIQCTYYIFIKMTCCLCFIISVYLGQFI
jgi:hypothetical protein